MPSDHVIAKQDAFRLAVSKAAPAARDGSFVLFGIKPTHSETGYGYIQPTEEMNTPGIWKIGFFKEKPDEKTAKELIDKGALWNSGIFLYSPRVLIDETQRLAPELVTQCREALQQSVKDIRCVTLGTQAYQNMIDGPFDRVLMERTLRGLVVPCDMGWSDVGSWQSLWQLAEKDVQGNYAIGNVIARDVRNSYIRSEGPAVAVMGVEDIAVIATKDAVLVAPRSRSQDIKNLLSAVENDIPDLAAEHKRANRPCGTYENIACGPNFLVKHIIVRPGRSLSLQKHYYRAEHWVVVAGTAKVECDDIETHLSANESTFIPLGSIHRLTNPGKTDLHLIEVQSGDYLGEDDIVRYADNYGGIAQKAKA
jgi:mannose-1-phosphate guanylyltransferase/mannose-1-phosphate guanylyltransferase/mannose-6-phosphate isomerase